MKNQPVAIIAGPCSIDYQNIDDLYQISQIKTQNKKKAVWGVRIVGLKSRTKLNPSGKGMGIDYQTFLKNMKILLKGGSLNDLETPPSVKIAADICQKTNLLVATEIMSPLLQLPLYQTQIPSQKLLAWNPAVNQLGWPIMISGQIAKKNDWYLGLKNGKWLGEERTKADQPDFNQKTTMEKTWEGIFKYTSLQPERVILIHRGVDIPEKKDYRNAPVHHLAARVKKAVQAKLFFDPSHSYGPRMREKIVEKSLRAMRLKIDEETYLYDGLLIEVGRSSTDEKQHITIKELEKLSSQISLFRDLLSPGKQE